ncbi:tetratricopeptide repeat protein [Lentimicrobium sp. L6]|uniref:tetratricopeptide repeat protein n=1 Tax=Lentimicrobium sp. L6 TaxID=2735916 RepID=UPI0015557582|nr:tetratricopeptide repeat protein [Lentimicrobium sp. L6]NPD84716.1 tetratricopeptide repeat protein [Lentimicrobium sp. L6]
MRLGSITVYYLLLVVLLFSACTPSDPSLDSSAKSGFQKEIINLAQLDQKIALQVTDSDIKDCEQALEIARTLNDKEIELQCLIRLFELQNKQELFKDALQTGNLSLNLAKELKDKTSQAQIYMLFGTNYYHLSSFHKSFENFETSLNYYLVLKDTTSQLNILNMQGNIYFNWQDYEMAYEYYNKCLELAQFQSRNSTIAKSLTNMGVVYAAQAENKELGLDSTQMLSKKAVQYIENALVFIDKTKQNDMRAEILNNLAQVYTSSNDYDRAVQTIKKAISISKPISDRIYINSCQTYAHMLFYKDSLTKAKILLEQVETVTKQKGFQAQYTQTLNLMSSISFKEKDFENAYLYQKKYAQLSDSIFNLDYKKKIDAIKLSSDMDKVIEEQKLKRQQNFTRTLIIIIILIAIIIIIGLLYSQSRTRNMNFKLQNNLLTERLETRNKELTTRIMALIQRNELEKEIVQKLHSLQPKMKKENQGDIKEIISDLSFKQNDQLWKEFEVRFESVHQEFFSKLSVSFPELTTNEKRLCAFLYLDMSSKDISSITGQSTRALNVARTRLRKKFDITNSQQSLSSFLNEI